jgi:hypothetical protein
VPATTAGLPRVSFFFFLFFVAAAINSTNEANKAQAVHAIKQSIFLDVYALNKCLQAGLFFPM